MPLVQFSQLALQGPAWPVLMPWIPALNIFHSCPSYKLPNDGSISSNSWHPKELRERPPKSKGGHGDPETLNSSQPLTQEFP